jgi:proteasome accessory factor A
MCNEFVGRRPIFTFGHFLKAAVVFAVFQDGGFRALMSPRQRLQISLGDSNMCEESEYLRIGATTLVIDTIEAGALPADAPRFRFAIRALKRFASDATLRTTVRSTDGREWTTLQVQRYYLDACTAFVATRPDAPAEAHEVLRRWREVLDLLETNPIELIGRVDWVTKQFLLDRCGGDAGADSWAVRKKIDLRYHEISTEGYFHQLAQTGLVTRALTPDEVERAQRTPPDGSRLAIARGRYIREFSLDPSFKAGWVCVSFGVGPTARRIDLGAESSVDALVAGVHSRG